MAAGNVFGENKEVGGGASSQPAVPKESDVPNKPNLPPAVMSVLKEKNKKPRPRIPESDLIKAARARAAAAASGAEPALVVNPAMNPNLNPTPNAASDIKASITAKAEAAAESRRSAVASAAAAARFATLAEEAKTMATSLKQARAVRVAAAAQDKTNTQTQAEVQKPNETREADATDDALATRLHRETNHASPRRGEDAIEKSPNSVPPSVAP